MYNCTFVQLLPKISKNHFQIFFTNNKLTRSIIQGITVAFIMMNWRVVRLIDFYRIHRLLRINFMNHSIIMKRCGRRAKYSNWLHRILINQWCPLKWRAKFHLSWSNLNWWRYRSQLWSSNCKTLMINVHCWKMQKFSMMVQKNFNSDSC